MAPVTIREKSRKTRKKYKKLALKSIIHRSITTPDNKKLWFPFPHLEHARNVSLSRKLLQLNYAFDTPGKNVKKQIKYPWRDWYDTLGNLKKQSYFGRQLRQRQQKGADKKVIRVDQAELTRNIMAYGIPEDRASAASKYATMTKKPEVEKFLCKIMNDKGKLTKTKLNIWPSLNSTDITSTPPVSSQVIAEEASSHDISPGRPSTSAIGEIDCPGISTLSSFRGRRNYNKPLSHNSDYDSDLGPVSEERLESWQMQKWLKPLQKEYFEVEMNEIWYNRRLLGKRTDPTSYKQKLTPPVTEILLEILRKAYFRQDWCIVAKTIEGLCKEASTPSYYALGHSRNWILWNTGFYSILRFEHNIGGASEAVQKFARNFHSIFVPRTYSRRLGVEVAIWLTQEGHFLEGINVMEEMSLLDANSRGTNKKMANNPSLNNPKMDLIDFVFHLIRAVHCYAIYCRDKSLLHRGLFVDETELHLKAELALSAFETLLEYSNKCEGEITTFLDQLIELTIECRSVERAKELFEEIVLKYYGNVFVEEAFEKFLDEHFSDQKDICKNLQIRRKFRFEPNPPWQHQGRTIAAYRHRQLSMRDNVKLSFTRVDNPPFSW